jgi:hypothetical protein
MAKEEKQSTQISWKMDGSRLTATIPVINETITVDVLDVHETWNLFLKGYGLQQHASSFLAKFSFSAPADMQLALSAAKKAKDEKAIAEAREAIRAEKLEWLKENAPKLRTELWKQLQVYKAEMTEKAKAAKETKAQIEARVKADLITKTRASLEAAGMPEDFIIGVISSIG